MQNKQKKLLNENTVLHILERMFKIKNVYNLKKQLFGNFLQNNFQKYNFVHKMKNSDNKTK